MSIRERLYPDERASRMLVRHCADARYVYNLGLEQRSFWRRGMSSISVYEQKRSLTDARQGTWLGEGSSVVQQQALFDLDRAFQNWWKNPGHFSRPTWRKAGVHEGFAIRDLSVRRINRKWGEVLVPKCGWVRFRITRQWADIAAGTSARVTLDRAGRWHVSFTAPPPTFERKPTGAVVGIDRGVKNTIATSDGPMSDIPTWTVGERARYLALQRRLSRQQRGSNRRTQTKAKLGRLHARLGDRRKDWIEKTTTELVRKYDMIGVEALPTRSMTRKPKAKPDEANPGRFLSNGARAKAGLNRAILASCWDKFEQRLADKTSQSDASSVLVRVDPRNTSRMCASCGHVAKENRKSQAAFVCQACGHEAHADTNAAINIREAARTTLLRPSGSELCGRTSANARRSGAHKASRERTQKSESSNGPAASTTKTEAAA